MNILSTTGIALLVLCALAVGLYSWFVRKRHGERWVDWLNTLVATATSILFSFMIGVFLFYWQQQVSDSMRRRDLAFLASNELEILTTLLDRPSSVRIAAPGACERVVIADLRRVTLQPLVESGLFSRGITEKSIAVINDCNTYDLVLGFLLESLQGQSMQFGGAGNAAWASCQLDTMRMGILQAAREVQDSLKFVR